MRTKDSSTTTARHSHWLLRLGIPENLKKMQMLKHRLKLKRLAIRIERQVEWNFGYCPSENAEFDKTLEKMVKLSETVRLTDREWWDQYDRYTGRDDAKNLPPFLV